MQQDWNSFWAGHGEGASLADAPINASSLEKGWREFFNTNNSLNGNPHKLADIACGTGVVAQTAREIYGSDVHLTCLDYAPAAIEVIRAKGQVDEALIGDASSLPFPDQAFDMVCSQFGIEYAGQKAFSEAARVLAPGGKMRIVTHFAGGAIEAESRTNLAVATGILESGVFEAADQAFETYRLARLGKATNGEMERDLKKVVETVPAFKAVIERAPEQCAGRHFAERLFVDFSGLFERLGSFDAEELISWRGAMQAETEAYAARMSAMISAAMTAEDAEKVCDLLRSQGLTLERTQPCSDEKEQIGWLIEGHRPNSA